MSQVKDLCEYLEKQLASFEGQFDPMFRSLLKLKTANGRNLKDIRELQRNLTAEDKDLLASDLGKFFKVAEEVKFFVQQLEPSFSKVSCEQEAEENKLVLLRKLLIEKQLQVAVNKLEVTENTMTEELLEKMEDAIAE